MSMPGPTFIVQFYGVICCVKYALGGPRWETLRLRTWSLVTAEPLFDLGPVFGRRAEHALLWATFIGDFTLMDFTLTRLPCLQLALASFCLSLGALSNIIQGTAQRIKQPGQADESYDMISMSWHQF